MDQTTRQSVAPDEIDLQDLARQLWAFRRLILIVTLVATCLAAAYAFLSTPTYEATTRILPPSVGALSNYNMAYQLSGPAITAITNSNTPNTINVAVQRDNSMTSDNAVPLLTPKEAYGIFLRQLSSENLRQQFFAQTYLPAHPQATTDAAKRRLLLQLDKNLTLITPKVPGSSDATTLTMSGKNPVAISKWANQYVEQAINASREQLLKDAESAVQLRLSSISDQIQTLRKVAKTSRQDQIIRVKTALAEAQAIGLENPPNSGNLITSYTDNTMYLRGAKALQAALHQLESRPNDDPYISELPDLLKKKELLQSIRLDPKSLAVVTVDQVATAPDEPIKPKKALIILLGIIGGAILGALFAWARLSFTATRNN